MKKNIMVKLLSILMMIILVYTIPVVANAKSVSDMVQGAEGFIQMGQDKQGEAFDASKMKTSLDTLYNALLIAGVVIATIIGLVLGIKFVTGSVEQKGKIKEALIPYIAGCVVIFGAFGIWRLIILILR